MTLDVGLALFCLPALDLPPRLQYTRVPEKHKDRKYLLPLLNISRLFLVNIVASMADDTEPREQFSQFFDGVESPSDWPQFYGPKVIARPADLSPGEYEMIPHLLSVYYGPKDAENMRLWANLCRAILAATQSADLNRK